MRWPAKQGLSMETVAPFAVFHHKWFQQISVTPKLHGVEHLLLMVHLPNPDAPHR
jgi:hypothetical protein